MVNDYCVARGFTTEVHMLLAHCDRLKKMTGHVTILKLYCFHSVPWLPTGSKDLIHQPNVPCIGFFIPFLSEGGGAAEPDRCLLSPENVLHMLYNLTALSGYFSRDIW